MNPTANVSVVVPFLNGAANLEHLLESLVVQDFTGSWELVAVDNGSTDGSREVVQRFGQKLQLNVVDAFERSNPSLARNAGARRAKGRHLLFIDADDAVDPHYISAMSEALVESPLVASRVDSTLLNAEWVRDVHGPAWQESGIGVFFDFLPATGVNIGIRRELFEQLGGFSEEFSGSEDVAFSWTAQLLAGVQIRFVPGALYYYRYRDSYSGLLRQSANWGRDTVRLYRRFRTDGMPGRSLHSTVRDWKGALRALLPAASPARRASALVTLGVPPRQA